MSLLSHLPAHFWLLFSLAVSIAVLRELRRAPDEPLLPGKSRRRR